MKLVVFGLTVSSSWGNGHATLWRGLIGALARRGHHIVFLERDVTWYANHRDVHELPGGKLVLYGSWQGVRERARRELVGADAAMITSYCPDAIAATALLLDSAVPVKCFYDLDTGVTLDRLRAEADVPYLPPNGLAAFDLVLSYIGGGALREVQRRLGARRVVPLYGSVDPDVHRPCRPLDAYRADLSYLGTFATDRQDALERLLIEPARRVPDGRFFIAGAQYPPDFPWTTNLHFRPHVPPGEHPAFYCSSRLTLNVTRRAMAEWGWCPSGRIFEAAACGVPVLTDGWPGLEDFYAPGMEILVAHTAEDTVAALGTSDDELARIARRARERTLAEHSADARAGELERLLDEAAGSARAREVA